MIEKNVYQVSATDKEWENAKCDKYDYMIAAFCGGTAGLIDVFFVGDPLSSVLGKSVDGAFDGMVKKAAHFFWEQDPRAQGRPKKCPESLEQCISYLEQAFPVNYDARYAKDLDVADGVLSKMRPLNHHLLSLAHSPDPIGLIFSIIDQYTGLASFVDGGSVIRVVPKKTSGAIPYLQGTDMLSRIFCGFVNWVGHLISDVVGSSSTRAAGKSGRGAGIPIPFYELFLACDFGDFDGKTFADVMVKVFEQGYDLRFGATMAIPVIIEELMIRVIWTIRRHYYKNRPWKECIPSSKHADLRIMLIVGNGTLCLVDGVDAAARGLLSGGNIVVFITHLNLVAWARLLLLVGRELYIRFGPIALKMICRAIDDIMSICTPAERKLIEDFNIRINAYSRRYDELFAEFVKEIDIEYGKMYLAATNTYNPNRTRKERAQSSADLAIACGVDRGKTIKDNNDLDKYLN